jgi:hypothetical protein
VIHQFDMGTCQPIGDDTRGLATSLVRREDDLTALRLLTVAESEAVRPCRRFPAAVLLTTPYPLSPVDD